MRAPIAMAIGVLAAIALVGCPEPPSSGAGGDCGRVEAARCPPCPVCAPDASPGAAGDAAAPPTVEALACANLAHLGCSEGADPTCRAKITQAEVERISRVDAACLARASSPAAAVRCGFVKCLTDGG